MTATTPSDRTRPPGAAGPRIGFVSVAASASAGVVILNLIIVNVAFPAMSRDLDASLTTIQWVSTAFVLGLMTTVPLTGWASAKFGLKRLLMVTLSVFLVASALCSAAWSVDSLILFRVLAGFAGGVIPPLAQSIVVRAAGGVRIGTAMAVLNGPILAVPVLGPTLGGLLLAAFGWRGVFLISIPLSALALALAARALPDDEPEEAGRLDVKGLVLLSSGLVLIVFGFTRFGGDAQTANGAAAISGGIVLVGLFALNARRLGPSALLDTTLFRQRNFLAPAVIAAVFSIMLFGSAAILPLYFETARGEAPVAAGLLVAIQGVGSVLGLTVSGRLTDRYGAQIVAPIAAVMILVGTVPWIWLEPDTGYPVLLAGLLARGAGLSALMNAAYAVAYGTLDRAAIPGATAALNIISRVSAAAGVAIAVVVLQGNTPDTVDLGARQGGAVVSHAVAAAFSTTFLLFALLAAAVLIPAFALPRSRGPARLSSEAA